MMSDVGPARELASGFRAASPPLAFDRRLNRVLRLAESQIALSPLLLLVRDDLSFDLVVSRLRNNLSRDQIALGPIRSSGNDLLRHHGSDAGKRLEFICARAVDVNQAAFLVCAR